MAPTLLSRKYLLILHIALVFVVYRPFLPVTAQSVLLPGDIGVVSVSADSQWVDFVPFLDIEEGTELYFGSGKWIDSAHSLEGEELKISFQEPVEAGTSIHVGNGFDSRVESSGTLNFKGKTHRLFVYQKENSKYRFIAAVGWGKGVLWNNGTQQGASDLPKSLREASNTVLNLGELNNYQYFVRNGASGTPALLGKFIYEEAHWRGSENEAFPKFGTSFNLLSPPVVLFENSYSSVVEADTTITLNVAIYEHDGSRLTVNVAFDSLRSTAGSEDFGTIQPMQTINFTGLIGDGMYEVHIPVRDDQVYEGRETGIFTLTNLTSGNFGDFLTHSLIIADNELPDVQISEIHNSSGNDSYVVIRNNEKKPVSLKGWSLITGRNQYYFKKDIEISPEATLTWMLEENPEAEQKTGIQDIFYAGLGSKFLLEQAATLKLENYRSQLISQLHYSARTYGIKAEEKRNHVVAQNQNAAGLESENIAVQNFAVLSAQQEPAPGWKIIPNNIDIRALFPDKSCYIWDAERLKFVEISPSSVLEEMGAVVFGYFEEEESEMMKQHKEKMLKTNENSVQEVTATLAASDQNENGRIDGIEGLNIVHNNSSSTFTAADFVKAWNQEFPEIAVEQQVYGVSENEEGKLVYRELMEDDLIPPDATFWVQLKETIEPTRFSVKPASYNQVTEARTKVNEENKGIELSLDTGNSVEKINLKFHEGEEIPKQTKNLNFYSNMLLPGHQSKNIAFGQGDDFFSHLSLSSIREQQAEIPVWIKSPTGNTFTMSISHWEDLPEGWMITLEDQLTGKSYELQENFNLVFEYNSVQNMNTQELDYGDKSILKAQRFNLVMTPPGARDSEGEKFTEMPREVELHQNYPNPFNPSTTISFYLPEPKWVKLSVFNVVGQPIAVIVEGTISAGEQRFEWDAADKPSGMYIYQLEVGNKVMTRKMTLVK